MKKKLFLIFVVVVASMALASLLIGCDNTTNNPDGTGTNALSENEVLAFSAATSVNILSELSNSDVMPTSAAPALRDPTDAQIERIHQQIVVMENFVNDVPFTVTEEVSDNALYQKKLSVSAVDLENHAASYLIYFNETLQPVNYDDPNEKEYFLNGIVVLNGMEYRINGEKETDTRNKEYQIDLFVYLDNMTYVEFEYETDRNEKEYEYKIVRNGVRVKEFSLEMEQKFGKQTLELKNFEANGTRIRYVRETENDGRTYIQATVIDATGTTLVKIYVTHNEAGDVVYHYVLPSGATKDIIRHPANATVA